MSFKLIKITTIFKVNSVNKVEVKIEKTATSIIIQSFVGNNQRGEKTIERQRENLPDLQRVITVGHPDNFEFKLFGKLRIKTLSKNFYLN